jgi:hypothetical protein
MRNDTKPSIEAHIAKLDKCKTPKRDLWQGIEFSLQQTSIVSADKYATQANALASKKKPRLSAEFAIAASVLMAILVGYFSFQSGRLESGQALVVQLSEQHSLQKNALLMSFKGQATTTQNWQQQLIELDEAAEAIKKALVNEPNNAALLNMLQRVYEKQITLIERVHAPAWQQI